MSSDLDLLADERLETLACPEQARRHRLHGTSHHRRGIFVAESFDLAQQERLAELGGQLLDRSFDRLARFPRLCELVGALVVDVGRDEGLVSLEGQTAWMVWGGLGSAARAGLA